MRGPRLVRRIAFYGGLLVLGFWALWFSTAMPGQSFAAPLPPPTVDVRNLAAELERQVVALSVDIGERRIGHGDSLERAQRYLVSELQKVAGEQRRVELEDLGSDGSEAKNVILTLPGRTHEIVVVGAHYDTAPGTQGANDNASGSAALVALARFFVDRPAQRCLRLVLFANEEPPYFQNPGMGSWLHAKASRARGETIVAMLSLESLGYYSEAEGSQRYPSPIGLLYPNRGNFLGFVGNPESRWLVHSAISTFRKEAAFPSEGAVLPSFIPGVGWSDHWAFWQEGYSAIMLTDTAVFRDPNYHEASDSPRNLDYERMARVTLGIRSVVTALLNDQ